MAFKRRAHWGFALAAPALLIVGACRVEPGMPANNASSASNVASPPPAAVIEPPPAIDRAELLIAAARARSAAAAGSDDREAQRSLDNRRFVFRTRLGCSIAFPEALEKPERPDGLPAAEARFDPEARRVTLSVAPDISLDDALVAAIAGEGVEAAEGFWVARPSLLVPACVVAAPEPAGIGLVEFYTSQDARTGRREGRPYATGVELEDGADAPAPGSWELVLRGRLRKHGDGRSISCRPREQGGMPVCLISVEFEEVAVERTGSGEQIARWGRG